MKRVLGEQERMFLAYTQLRDLRMVRAGQLLRPLEITQEQEREIFRRLSRGGLIARVRPGLYLVPPRLPLGGSWSPDEILALNTLIEDRKGKYQICGPNAFNRYGFDQQIPTRVYAYNNRFSGNRTIGKVELALIEVANSRLGDVEAVKTAQGRTAVYSSRTRTLIDAVYDWSRFNSLPRAYDWICNELSKRRVTVGELVQATLRYGDKGTIRRIGVLLEREAVDARLLRKLEKALPQSSSLIPWIPTLPKRGTVNRRWGVVVNGDL
jgi:predicted transcriptional regulator of viral defense system